MKRSEEVGRVVLRAFSQPQETLVRGEFWCDLRLEPLSSLNAPNVLGLGLGMADDNYIIYVALDQHSHKSTAPHTSPIGKVQVRARSILLVQTRSVAGVGKVSYSSPQR